MRHTVTSSKPVALFLLVGALLGSLLVAGLRAQPPARPQAPKGPWMDTALSPDQRADLVIEQMTLDEKISLLHGRGGFQAEGAISNGGAGVIQGVPRLGLPPIQLADAAVGVRAAAERGRYATLLPSTIAAAASWDMALAYEYGALIGRELRDQQYNSSLGGGVNLMREPRNGRNFEYLGEDPILAGKMVAQVIKGKQSQKVIADLKHYAINDQETGRNIGNVKMSTRVMRETDLLAFEIAVLEGQPGMVMCSYNKVNGDWACENDYLLNQLLKKTWGFKGFVVSDWNATHSTAKAALAGLDAEQPGGPPERARFGDALKKAVEAGEVPMSRIDDMVRRIVRTAFAAGIVDDPPRGRVVDPFAGADTAQRIAEQSSVLLRNANHVLPLDAAVVKSIAIIGSKADTSVLSGGGSAQVDPPGGGPSRFGGPAVWFPSSPLKAIRAKAPKAKVEFHDGVDLQAAAALAKTSEVAIVFVNEPTSEGRDLPTLSLSGTQNDLVSAVAAANPRTIVVLQTGGPAAMPWIDSVERGHRDLVSGHQGRRGAGQHPVRRRESVGEAAGDVPEVGGRPASPRDLRIRSGASRAAPRRGRRPAAAIPDGTVRHRVHRRPQGRLQVVPGREQGAAVRLRPRPVVHDVRLLGPEGDDRLGVVHRPQHRQARRRRDRTGLRGPAGRRQRAAEAAGGVGEDPAGAR